MNEPRDEIGYKRARRISSKMGQAGQQQVSGYLAPARVKQTVAISSCNQSSVSAPSRRTSIQSLQIGQSRYQHTVRSDPYSPVGKGTKDMGQNQEFSRHIVPESKNKSQVLPKAEPCIAGACCWDNRALACFSLPLPLFDLHSEAATNGHLLDSCSARRQ